MDASLVTLDAPTDADRNAILAPLTAFNAANGFPADLRPVAIVVRDSHGDTVGGLWGRTVYDWLFVDYLVVPASMKEEGLGTWLMTGAEAIAADRGCIGSWLITVTSRAQGF